MLPFTQTLFLWQSIVLTVVLIIVTLIVAWLTTPQSSRVQTAADLGLVAPERTTLSRSPERPGEWLEYSPFLSIAIAALGAAWLANEFSAKGPAAAIANLNTYNFLFLMLGLLLCWRPRVFLESAARAVPGVTGVLIQFPLYGGIAAIITHAASADGSTLAAQLSALFTQAATHDSFAVLIGAYSALLGFFIPSGGGKWIIEAPYVMQAANELKFHLGWTVQIYNAAEALPNLINPFWMLPLLGIVGLKARDVIGFTMIQLVIHVPIVLFLLWALGTTLEYVPPVMP